MKKVSYSDLLKIKHPVLILRVFKDEKENHGASLHSWERLRILYPNGRCEYITYLCYGRKFKRSCFSGKNLIRTVEDMQELDDSYYDIYIQEIK